MLFIHTLSSHPLIIFLDFVVDLMTKDLELIPRMWLSNNKPLIYPSFSDFTNISMPELIFVVMSCTQRVFQFKLCVKGGGKGLQVPHLFNRHFLHFHLRLIKNTVFLFPIDFEVCLFSRTVSPGGNTFYYTQSYFIWNVKGSFVKVRIMNNLHWQNDLSFVFSISY